VSDIKSLLFINFSSIKNAKNSGINGKTLENLLKFEKKVWHFRQNDNIPMPHPLKARIWPYYNGILMFFSQKQSKQKGATKAP